MTYSRIRVEETPPPVAEIVQAPPAQDLQAEVERWRKMAIQAGERLAYAENQLKDLRQAADDARARFTKYKNRLDSANERVNDLQSQIIAVSAERDTLKARQAEQDVVKQKLWEYRQSLLDGPLFELFGEFCK
jgi:chromosome segregation ATPase